MTHASTVGADAPLAPPPGWGDGLWRLSGRSETAGWLLQPHRVEDAEAWVDAQTAELQEAWGARWRSETEPSVRALLRLGLDARPVDAALAFQLWPVPAPLVAHVHAAFGAAPEVAPGPGAGSLYEAEGLGVGVQVVRRVRAEEVDLVGLDIAFVAGESAVVASFEPTVPELFALLIGQFHAFVQTLEFIAPDGTPVRASAPAGFLDASADADWADTVPTR
ncbi:MULTISPECIES: hypothetical protein [Microbacterium]|uniref:Uncharacterized protein n=1 Tax=Microbacterium saccharophilum TaxID=1213358 RepID=A0A7Z7GEA1_9MICO|nr:MULTISPECIES: hypothetical protein [Microbacterium]SFI66680.1 hypothetical protein SAMN04487751_2587 [Microbacterium saccharophilum]